MRRRMHFATKKRRAYVATRPISHDCHGYLLRFANLLTSSRTPLPCLKLSRCHCHCHCFDPMVRPFPAEADHLRRERWPTCRPMRSCSPRRFVVSKEQLCRDTRSDTLPVYCYSLLSTPQDRAHAPMCSCPKYRVKELTLILLGSFAITFVAATFPREDETIDSRVVTYDLSRPDLGHCSASYVPPALSISAEVCSTRARSLNRSMRSGRRWRQW